MENLINKRISLQTKEPVADVFLENKGVAPNLNKPWEPYNVDTGTDLYKLVFNFIYPETLPHDVGYERSQRQKVLNNAVTLCLFQGSYGIVKLAYNEEDDTHYVRTST